MPTGTSLGRPRVVGVWNTVPGIKSWCGNSGSVQPMHGMPARVFDDWRFPGCGLQGDRV